MKIDWFEQLQGTLDTERCVPVRVHAEGEYIEGTVHACRLPPAQAAEARRRVRAKAKKKGRCVQQRTLVLAEWVLIFTT
ncbi:MAG: IS4/IS5 family transposase, partial [Gammaproteobacteria bacterium]